MKKTTTHMMMVSMIALSIVLMATSPAMAKKAETETNLKKVVAIGNVEMGNMGFSSMGPGGVSDMFRQKTKAILEKTGRYVVVLPKYEKGEAGTVNAKAMSGGESEIADMPAPKTAAEAQRYMEKMMAMQREFQKDAARSSGKYAHEPVAVQGLFNFIASKGSAGVSSGGIFSTAESLGAPRGIGEADFSADSVKIELTCLMLDPEAGGVIDQHTARASSARMAQVGGTSYYTMEDTSDPDRAFERMFNRALRNCTDWIDKKMGGRTWEAQIFKAKGKELYVNAGTNAGVAEGMTFDAYAREEVSGGGISVGNQDSKTGTVQISKAFDGYSIATPLSGVAAAGSVLKRASD